MEKVNRLAVAILQKFSKLGPLGPLAFFYIVGLCIFTASRITLLLIHWSRVTAEPDFGWIFVIGLRIDTLVLCYLMIFPAVLQLLFCREKGMAKFAKYGIHLYIAGFLSFFIFMEICTLSFIEEYDLRPDRIFIEYLKYVDEVAGTLWVGYKLELFIMIVLVGIFGFIFFHSTRWLVENSRPWKWRTQLIALPFLVALLIFGGRSSLSHRPANISTASFSDNHFVNELGLNSSYSVLYAVYRLRHEGNSFRIYGKMKEGEIFRRVKERCTVPAVDFVESKVPMLHKQKSPFARKRPCNVVIFLQESLGAEFVGALGGPPVTPNFDRLAQEGMFFTNLHATGTRTVRGIEATVCGFLPTPGRSVVKLELAKKGFFTAGELFRRHGYDTHFIYGGMSNFDEMRAFFIHNGVTNIHDEPTFANPVFRGVWGVSDEDLVRKAHEIFCSQGDKPFFAVLLSTSQHSPYEFPDGRIELYERPKATMLNAIKYSDYAIGELFRLAKTASYYENTLFLVIADHNTKLRGDSLVPIHKFHIPGFITGPDVPQMKYDKLASQIDMLPTLLHFSGLEVEHPMVGRNLMTLPADTPGRAVMQYGKHNAYQVGEQVLVMRPYQEPKQFRYERDSHKLIPIPVDSEFSRDALAHSLFPWLLYTRQQYRLP